MSSSPTSLSLPSIDSWRTDVWKGPRRIPKTFILRLLRHEGNVILSTSYYGCQRSARGSKAEGVKILANTSLQVHPPRIEPSSSGHRARRSEIREHHEEAASEFESRDAKKVCGMLLNCPGLIYH